ncbi:hypothetical protein, partial [Terribacillus sp. AE2B 122]
ADDPSVEGTRLLGVCLHLFDRDPSQSRRICTLDTGSAYLCGYCTFTNCICTSLRAEERVL